MPVKEKEKEEDRYKKRKNNVAMRQRSRTLKDIFRRPIELRCKRQARFSGHVTGFLGEKVPSVPADYAQQT